jgi:hypothetical protein
MGKVIAGKVFYGLVCLLAAVLLVVSGYANEQVGLTTDLEKGISISNSPSVGAMNILVMGLESRTNFEGQTLPNSLLTAMHAGNASAVSAGQVGAQDTDTLILIHIFAGGRVEVLLGSSATAVPAGLGSPGTAGTQSVAANLIGAQVTPSPSPSPSPSTVTGADNGQTGGSVTVTANAPYGIPCVY